MKYKELKNKSKVELKRMLKENSEKIREMRFKVANRSLKNVSSIKDVRRLIAKINTALKNENKEVKKVEVKEEKK